MFVQRVEKLQNTLRITLNVNIRMYNFDDVQFIANPFTTHCFITE